MKTVAIDNKTHRELRIYAAEKDLSLSDIVIKAIENEIKQGKKEVKKEKINSDL